MQVTVSRVSPVVVELTVSLPKEKVSTALAREYEAFGKQAQIRGFRKGKVPLPLLKQYFGQRVTAKVWGQLVDESLPRALEEQKLEPVVQPNVVPASEPIEGADWTYTAKLEVRPEVAEIKLDDIDLKRAVYTFTDKDVDHQIDHLRDQHATVRTPDPARAAKATDLITLDYEVSIDGSTRDDLAVKNRSVELGKGRLLKELEDGIPGMSVGEARDIKVTFNDTHAREDLRGKDATLKVTAKEIREKVLPEVDDEFAKDVGSESLKALREKIRADIEKEATQASENQLREDAVTALAEKNPIEVPPSLVNNALGMIARELAQQVRMSGGAMDTAKLIETAKTQAEMRVRAGLLLGEMARKNGLDVNDDDINARLDEMAKETGKAVAKLRAEHRSEEKRSALASAVLEDKVVALLLSKVKVTNVPAEKPFHDHDH